MVVVLTGLAAPGTADAQATRTWVSAAFGVGDDANPCSRTAPCRTLARAISVTAAKGEINAITPGQFGVVTVAKAIDIDLSFGRGSVLYDAVTGVTVNAGVSDMVILRGIHFHGINGVKGVKIIQAGSVVIEDCTFTGSATAAISIEPTAADTTVTINGVDIRNGLGTGNGIAVIPGTGHAARVGISNVVITGTQTAVQAGAGATAWLEGSMIFGNALGLNAVNGGVINLFTDTRVFGNAVDGEPTSVLDLPPGTPGATGPAGATGATGANGTTSILLRPKSLRATRGTGIRAEYVATVAGPGVVTIRRQNRVVTRYGVRIQRGAHSVRWNGRIGHRPAPTGVYSLTVQVTGPGGTVARHRTPLVIG